MAYQLELPPGSQIHPVVDVSLFKKQVGKGFTPSSLPITEGEEATEVTPRAMIERRMVTRKNPDGLKWLVQWSNMGVEEATWEDLKFIRAQFPNFDPCGEGSS